MSAAPWVPVNHVPQHLSVPHDDDYSWIDGKGLPTHKLGRLWKFKLSEVDDWMRASCSPEGGPTDEAAGT
jgi:excisionase family DNA binding protein